LLEQHDLSRLGWAITSMRRVEEKLNPFPLEFSFFHPALGQHDNSHFTVAAAQLGWLRLA